MSIMNGYDSKILRLSGVTQRFGEPSVLHDVSLEVAAGEYVAVVGDSGIGKSTLLNVIAGLESFHSGEIFFENLKINALDDDALTILRREKLGFFFQGLHILPKLTVEHKLGLPLLLRQNPDGGKSRSGIPS